MFANLGSAPRAMLGAQRGVAETFGNCQFQAAEGPEHTKRIKARPEEAKAKAARLGS